MKKITKLLSVILAVLMVMALAVPAFAEEDADDGAAAYNFNDGAYASIVTGSDFQKKDGLAYTRFYNTLSKLKEDGLETPHSILCGGDYSKFIPDVPTPGIKIIKEKALEVYPDLKEENIICIQGNHDVSVSCFTQTGFYDMGAYTLYAINEDDFFWGQIYRPDGVASIKNLRDEMKKSIDKLIADGDTRPFIVITHVPLHYSTRTFGGDNKYSSIIFDLLNKAGEKLDIVFMYGHNHSDHYDDYIGGAVNFMAPGETILIPDRTKLLDTTAYTEETLNFTYTNCGYIGYSNNASNETSTRALTLGVIRLTTDSMIFVKYTDEGLFRYDIVARKNAGDDGAEADGTKIFNEWLWNFLKKVLDLFPAITEFFHFLV